MSTRPVPARSATISSSRAIAFEAVRTFSSSSIRPPSSWSRGFTARADPSRAWAAPMRLAAQIVQRVDVEVGGGARGPLLGRHDRLVQAAARLHRLGRGQGAEPEGHGDHAGVDHPYRHRSILGGEQRGVVRAREFAREVQRDDADGAGFGRSPVRGGEDLGAGPRRRHGASLLERQREERAEISVPSSSA